MLGLGLAGDTETETSTFHFSARKPDNQKLKWMLEQYIQTYSVSSLVRPVNELIASDDMLFPSRNPEIQQTQRMFQPVTTPLPGPPSDLSPSLPPPSSPPPSLSLDQSKDSDHFYDEVIARNSRQNPYILI